MRYADETRRLRRQLDELVSRGDLPPDADPGAPTVLVRTVTVTTYPTVAQRFYGVIMTRPWGTESEGSAVTLTTTTGTFYALNLGSAIPASGTYLLATLIGGRWVFRYD